MNQKNTKPSLPLNQNKKKANLGEYSEYVGKSMFKLIPEGVDADYKDNFAALGGGSDEEENYEQVEMGEDVEIEDEEGEEEEI